MSDASAFSQYLQRFPCTSPKIFKRCTENNNNNKDQELRTTIENTGSSSKPQGCQGARTEPRMIDWRLFLCGGVHDRVIILWRFSELHFQSLHEPNENRQKRTRRLNSVTQVLSLVNISQIQCTLCTSTITNPDLSHQNYTYTLLKKTWTIPHWECWLFWELWIKSDEHRRAVEKVHCLPQWQGPKPLNTLQV